MNKLTKQEIVTIFGKYLFCPAWIFDDDEPTPDRIEGIDARGELVICERVSRDPQLVKLILMPVPHMSNEQILMACNVYDPTGLRYARFKNVEIRDDDATDTKKIIIQDTNFTYLFDRSTGAISLYNRGTQMWAPDTQSHLTQWYFKNNIAIPLHFEPSHWANNKTAIDLGIAVPTFKLLNEVLNKKFANDRSQVQEWYFEKKLHGLNLFDLANLNEAIDELKKDFSRA